MNESKSEPWVYGQSLTLLTDLYQITMAYGYWKEGIGSYESVFHHSFRKPPFKSGYTLAAGLHGLVQYLERFTFDPSDLAYLGTLKGVDGKPLFERAFLDYLRDMRFSCDIWAVEEGTPVFPYEPLVRVQGPLIQCQLLETPLLNLINFPTLIATKASRVRRAAGRDQLIEFGLRRAQGPDGALTASRAAYIGGCDSTSNVLAGKLFGIPVKGTHAHSWIMVFDEELESFLAYARQMPSNCIFLVDTYDTLEGVRHAIEAGRYLRKIGHEMIGIRLDSGDLAYLSIEARKMLDDAGFTDAKIVASNELDEHLITDLKNQGAQITVWGVGTNLVTAKDHPALDGVYKISAIRKPGGEWKLRLKLSEQMVKISNPGMLQIRRFYDHKGYIGDAIYDELTEVQKPWTAVDPLDPTRTKTFDDVYDSEDLLKPIYRKGSLVYDIPPLASTQAHAAKEPKRLHEGIKRFNNPHQYVAGLEKTLYNVKIGIVNNLRKKAGLPANPLRRV